MYKFTYCIISGLPIQFIANNLFAYNYQVDYLRICGISFSVVLVQS